MNGEQVENKNIQPEDYPKMNYVALVIIIAILAVVGWYFFLRGETVEVEVIEEEKPIEIIYERIEILSPEFIDEEVFLSVVILKQQEEDFLQCKMEEFEDGSFICPEPLSLFGTFGEGDQEYQIWVSDPGRYNKESRSDFVASNIFIDGQKVDFRQKGKYQYGYFSLK